MGDIPCREWRIRDRWTAAREHHEKDDSSAVFTSAARACTYNAIYTRTRRWRRPPRKMRSVVQHDGCYRALLALKEY